MNARFKCLRCNYLYFSNLGPTQCPKCGNLYVKWENYTEWREKANEQKLDIDYYGDKWFPR